jgi:hypothetical protein
MATDVLRDFQEKLDEELEGLNIPEQRRKVSLTNLQWLSRNLPVYNAGTPLKNAQKVVVNLIRNRKQAGL